MRTPGPRKTQSIVSSPIMADPRNKASFDKADQYKGRLKAYLKGNSSYGRTFTAIKLAKIYGIHEVTVRQAIGKARDEGAPIGSCSTGFFYAKTADELTETIKDFTSRIAAMSKRLAALIETRIKMNGGSKQESMFNDKFTNQSNGGK